MSEKKGLSPMVGFWIMVGTAVLAVAARAVQLFCAIDYETGFYKDHFSVALLNVILWIGIPISIIFTLVGMSRRYKAGTRLKKSFTVTVFLAVASALTCIQTLGRIYSSVYFAASGVSEGVGGFKEWMMIILLAGSCAAFATCAFDCAKGRPFGFYIVVPMLYMACKLIMTFMELTTIANISENLFNILSLSSAVVFLCSFAKIGMSFSGKTAPRLLLVSAYCTAVFGFVYVIPNYILSVCDMIGVVSIGGFADSVVGLNVEELAVCVLAAVYIGVFLKRCSSSVDKSASAEESINALEAAESADFDEPIELEQSEASEITESSEDTEQ